MRARGRALLPGHGQAYRWIDHRHDPAAEMDQAQDTAGRQRHAGQGAAPQHLDHDVGSDSEAGIAEQEGAPAAGQAGGRWGV